MRLLRFVLVSPLALGSKGVAYESTEVGIYLVRALGFNRSLVAPEIDQPFMEGRQGTDDFASNRESVHMGKSMCARLMV